MKGELVATHWCIALLFEFVLVIGKDDVKTVLIEKINSMSVDSDNEFVKQGADNFKNRLLSYLRDADSTISS